MISPPPSPSLSVDGVLSSLLIFAAGGGGACVLTPKFVGGVKKDSAELENIGWN